MVKGYDGNLILFDLKHFSEEINRHLSSSEPKVSVNYLGDILAILECPNLIRAEVQLYSMKGVL